MTLAKAFVAIGGLNRTSDAASARLGFGGVLALPFLAQVTASA